MMVLRGSLAAAHQGIPANQAHLFPADKCVWGQIYDGTAREHQIQGAYFFSGNVNAVQIQNPQLGYIGKSGRFVEIAS